MRFRIGCFCLWDEDEGAEGVWASDVDVPLGVVEDGEKHPGEAVR